MKKQSKLLLGILFAFIALTSCEKEKIKEDIGAYADGIYIVNEGNFGQGNASVSFLNKDFNSLTNNVYNTVNSLDLGDQAQSIGFNTDNAYIIVTGSNKIEVVEKDKMERIVTIRTNLTNPRYFEKLNDHIAFVTCWGSPSDATDDYLAILNTDSNTVSGTIALPLGPEKMIANNDYIFIAHKGAWGTNNIVSVLDKNTQQIIQTIQVGDRPNSMQIKDNFLYVLCSGEPSWSGTETAGQLFKIDISNSNFDIVQTNDFATTEHPDFLNLDDNSLYYYLNNNVYQMAVNDTSLPTTEFLSYATAYNMQTKDGKLYITDANGFTQEGSILIYDLSNASQLATKELGIIPGAIGFNF